MAAHGRDHTSALGMTEPLLMNRTFILGRGSGGLQKTSKSWNMGLGCFMLEFLLL